MARKNLLVLNADRPALRPAGGGEPLPELVFQEPSSGEPTDIVVGGAMWSPDNDAVYFGGKGSYATVAGAWQQITLRSDYLVGVFEGYRTDNSAAFEVTKNGQVLFSDTQAGPAGRAVYAEITGQPGDTLRMTSTEDKLFFCDQARTRQN